MKELIDRNTAIHAAKDAEIDALIGQRDEATAKAKQLTGELAEARAQIAALTPKAKAWDALEALRPLFHADIPQDSAVEDKHRKAIEAADRRYQAAAARAREVTK